MSCCGSRRQLSGHVPPRGHSMNTSSNTPEELIQTQVEFEYTGRTALTVMGPLTWQRYRFEKTGAIVSVDARDAAAMMVVPYLRRVKPA